MLLHRTLKRDQNGRSQVEGLPFAKGLFATYFVIRDEKGIYECATTYVTPTEPSDKYQGFASSSLSFRVWLTHFNLREFSLNKRRGTSFGRRRVSRNKFRANQMCRNFSSQSQGKIYGVCYVPPYKVKVNFQNWIGYEVIECAVRLESSRWKMCEVQTNGTILETRHKNIRAASQSCYKLEMGELHLCFCFSYSIYLNKRLYAERTECAKLESALENDT